MLEPELLILDEPTAGMSPSLATEIGQVLRKLNQELGMTILLVEHQLPFARHLADRFCLMDKGRSVANGTLGQLDEGLIDTYLTE
jgi:ABC-type branched-subunit amino acid transport system ATPase component